MALCLRTILSELIWAELGRIWNSFVSQYRKSNESEWCLGSYFDLKIFIVPTVFVGDK